MTTQRPEISGIHHVKFPVRDVEATRDWYCDVLGFEPELEFKEDGRLMGVSLVQPESGVRLAFRHLPERADFVSGFDPIALAVDTRADLERWVTYLDGKGIAHTPVTAGTVGWLISCHDPNSMELRIYTVEEHGGA